MPDTLLTASSAPSPSSFSNLLLDPLPTEGIRSDYRHLMQFELLMQDAAISNYEKVEKALGLFYLEPQRDIKGAWEYLSWFYSCGRKERTRRRRQSPIPRPAEIEEREQSGYNHIYSFEHDAPDIFAAFWTQYHIDLAEIDLHWWKFHAMFINLDESLRFSKIMYYRQVDLSKFKNKNERKFYARMKKIYALPDNRTFEQKVRDFGASIPD